MGKITCPSATCEPGARLLGAVGADGRIKHLRTPITIDETFVERARSKGVPEAQMRFAAPCQEGACSHWTGAKCGLIDKVVAHLDTIQPDPRRKDLQPCTIRSSCRWYSQTGATACLSCDLVVRQPEPELAT